MPETASVPDFRTLGTPPLTVNRRLFDRFVRRAHQIERVKRGLARDTSRFLRDSVFSGLGETLTSALNRIRGRRDVAAIHGTKAFRSLVKTTQGTLNAGYGRAMDDLAKQLRFLAFEESRFVVNVLGQDIPFDYSAKVPALRDFRKAIRNQPFQGRTLQQWFRGMATNTATQTVSQINLGLLGGETTGQIVRRVTGRKGVFDRALGEAERIAETAAGHAGNSGAGLAIEANEEVVQWEVWTAILDSATCFPAGQRVMTSQGWVPIEKVVPGDYVMSHKGRLRRVVAVRSKPYTGEMVTIGSGSRSVTSTADHRFLTRSGWKEAADFRRGHTAKILCEAALDDSNHLGGDLTVERGIGDTDHREALTPDCCVPAGFPHGDILVPIGGINLKADVKVREEEVNRPTADSVFLNEAQIQFRETESDVSFRRGLSSETSIASETTETAGTLTLGVDRDNAKRLPAMLAVHQKGGAPTLLGTMPTAGHTAEQSAAPRTFPFRGTSTSHGTSFVFSCGAAGDGEVFAARDTRLFNVMKFHRTRGGTRRSLAEFMEDGELIPTDDANLFHAWLAWFAKARMRVRSLVRPVTGIRTEPLRLAGQRPRADFTSAFHDASISKMVVHNTAEIKVYDLQVEEDQSFIVEGFVAHNCQICGGLDGNRYPVGEGPIPIDSTHPVCRCSRIPVLKSAKELGLKEGDLTPIERRAMDGKVSEKTTYKGWIRKQPARVQDEFMGPTRGRLYRAGKIKIDELVDTQLRPLDLKELRKRQDLSWEDIKVRRRPRPEPEK